MGNFAGVMRYGKISEDMKKKLKSRIKLLMREAGLMEMYTWSDYGLGIDTISLPRISDKTVDVCYSYFEDDIWENAGYSDELGGVYSGKIGGSYFAKALLAAYVLEGRYYPGFSMVIENDGHVLEKEYMSWINYIFKEKFSIKLDNPWTIYEYFHRIGKLEQEFYKIPWKKYLDEAIGVWGYYGVYAVQKGTSYIEHDYHDINIPQFFKMLKNHLLKYKRKSLRENEQQVSEIMQIVQNSCENIDSFACREEAELLVGIEEGMKRLKHPVIAVKLIAEIYEKDFWELWKSVSEVAKNFPNQILPASHPIEPESTISFFRTSNDELLLLGLHAENTEFSEEMLKWMNGLKKRFDDKMLEDYEMEEPLRWIWELLVFADTEYYRIYAFTHFLKETMKKLPDKKYIVLWKLFEEMLYSPEMLSKVDLIMTPRGKPYRWNNFVYYEKRRLPKCQCKQKEIRENEARAILRRYMALIANKKVRVKVFGF